ncbi:MAG: hypothetical protein NVS1B7_5320 [Candidatus Saccharimonadales bacterium]
MNDFQQSDEQNTNLMHSDHNPSVKHGISRDRHVQLSSAFMLIVVCLGAGFGGGWIGAKSNKQASQQATLKSQQQIFLNESQLISSIAKNVSPSVVSVNVTSQSQQQTIFGFAQPTVQQSAGTGIIISVDGYIITNRHVVPTGSTSVNVTLSDGTKLDNVEVVGRTNDSDTLDVAFLKIKDAKGKKLVAAQLGDSSKISEYRDEWHNLWFRTLCTSRRFERIDERKFARFISD